MTFVRYSEGPVAFLSLTGSGCPGQENRLRIHTVSGLFSKNTVFRLNFDYAHYGRDNKRGRTGGQAPGSKTEPGLPARRDWASHLHLATSRVMSSRCSLGLNWRT